MNTRSWFVRFGVVGCVIGLSLTACREEHHTSAPVATTLGGVYSDEHGPVAPYLPSATDGITVKADFTTYHKDGQPYGNWVMEATWRSEARTVVCPDGDRGVGDAWQTYRAHECAWATVPVTIDDTTGQGVARLSPAFLNTVFKAAHDRYQPNGANAVWHNAPGLYVNYYPADDATRAYYQFE